MIPLHHATPAATNGTVPQISDPTPIREGEKYTEALLNTRHKGQARQPL